MLINTTENGTQRKLFNENVVIIVVVINVQNTKTIF